jgi:hypothetical protein
VGTSSSSSTGNLYPYPRPVRPLDGNLGRLWVTRRGPLGAASQAMPPSAEGRSLDIHSHPQYIVLGPAPNGPRYPASAATSRSSIQNRGYGFPRRPLLGISVNRGSALALSTQSYFRSGKSTKSMIAFPHIWTYSQSICTKCCVVRRARKPDGTLGGPRKRQWEG